MRNPILLSLLLSSSLGLAQFDYDAKIIDYVGLKYPCNGGVTPVLKIRNEGLIAMSGCVVETWKNGLLINTFDWQLAIPSNPNEVRQPAFPPVPDVAPGDQLEFRIKTVNEIPDQNPLGNDKIVDLDAVHASTEATGITVKIRTDDAPGDLTWEIRNSLNQLVASGGPYVDEYVTIEVPVSLTPGSCYNFKAVDSGRDLLSGAQVQVLGGSNVLLSVEGAQLMDGTPQGLSTGNGGSCTEFLTVELHTDDAPEETSWEIIDQQNSAIVCTGSGGYPAGSYVTDNCCLPIGCYRLRVLDAGGDGINSGGYILRNTGDHERVIDNTDNFSTGSTSAISAAAGFCLPIGTDRTIFSSCDKLDWVSNKFIVATENAAVSAQLGLTNSTSGYEFWFFDPNGTYSFRRFRSHATSDGFGSGATRACHFKINRWTHTALTPHLPSNVLLNVRIRGRAAGTNFEFGPACRFKIDPVLAACPRIQLQDNPLSNDYSCGVYKVFGGSNSTANRITAIPPRPIPTVSSANVRYQFRFRVPGEGICIVRPAQTSATLYLNWNSGEQLRCGTPYEVDVRTSLDGGSTWCAGGSDPACDPMPAPWGVVCQLNITSSTYCPGNMVPDENDQARPQEGEIIMFPNPTTGGACYLTVRGVDGSSSNVSINVFDLSGKVVSTHSIPVADGQVSARTDLATGLSSGVYLVQVQAGERFFTERLIVRND